MPTITHILTERFWEKVDMPSDLRECWLWIGWKDRQGYGRIGVGSAADRPAHSERAHRLSYFLHYGEPPANKPLICHHCDNPPCVNPTHLFAGTHGDNQRDKVAKGRHYEQGVTHCPRGHPYDAVNTLYDHGRRRCRICTYVQGRERQVRHQARFREDALVEKLAKP